MSLVVKAHPDGRAFLARPSVRVFLTVVLGVLVGADAVLFPDAPLSLLVVLAALVGVALYLLSRSSRWAIAGILVTTITGLNVLTRSVGPIELRTADVFYVALLGWAVVRRRTAPASDVGQKQLVVLLGAMAASLIPLLGDSVGEFFTALVPWARLVSTFSLVWLVPRLVTNEQDRRFVIGALEVAIIVTMGRALVDLGPGGIASTARVRGAIGPNAFGLISATLIVLALHSPVPRSKMLRFVMVAVGGLGLVGARSIGSFVAIGLILGVAGFGPGNTRLQAAIRPLRVALLATVVVLVVATLRQESLPGSRSFKSSSAEQRLILGTAGLRLFEEHPLLGVGWQRSARPDVIGDPALSDALRQQFADAPVSFFPDQTVNSVHNTYIQVLAETGLCGGAALLALMLGGARRVRKVVRSLTGDEGKLARAALLVVALTLIWFNDNPLYGAQPETVIAATMLGILASFAPHRDHEAPSPEINAEVAAAGHAAR